MGRYGEIWGDIPLLEPPNLGIERLRGDREQRGVPAPPATATASPAILAAATVVHAAVAAGSSVGGAAAAPDARTARTVPERGNERRRNAWLGRLPSRRRPAAGKVAAARCAELRKGALKLRKPSMEIGTDRGAADGGGGEIGPGWREPRG